MKNIEQLAKIAENTPFTIDNVFLCYKNDNDYESYTPIVDVLAFGPPADLDDQEMELMNDHLYVFSDEAGEFIVLQ